MRKLRDILGLVAGVILILSGGMHSLMGWPALRSQLAATNAPADLVTGLALGWHFAGAAMLAMGIIVLHVFIGRLRALQRSRVPVQVIGVLYVVAGCAAFAATGGVFFFGVFIAPGVLLLVASVGADAVLRVEKPEDRL